MELAITTNCVSATKITTIAQDNHVDWRPIIFVRRGVEEVRVFKYISALPFHLCLHYVAVRRYRTILSLGEYITVVAVTVRALTITKR